MEAGGVDQISRLLQRMREERGQAKPPTAAQRPQTAGNRGLMVDPLDEEEEEDVLPSRYVKPRAEDLSDDELGEVSEDSEEDIEERVPPPRQPRAASLRAFERPISSESEDDQDQEDEDEVEDPRTKLSKRMDELRARRQMLGPPSRVQPEPLSRESDSPRETQPPPPVPELVDDPEPKPKAISRPKTAQAKPASMRVSRPTAPSFIRTPAKKPRKTDPVSLYQQRQKEWQNSKFLKANKENAKEGRKLKLAEYAMRPSFQLVHEKPPVPPKTQYVAPHEKRRDDLRFQTRVTLMQVKMAAPVDLKRPQTAKS